MLPPDHPQRVEAQLGAAIAALQREDENSAASVLQRYMDEEEERITKVCALAVAGPKPDE